MNPDDDVCYCYHVSLRKLVHFARRTRPRCPAQMSECLGAGTGCGWCIPVLTQIATFDGKPDDFPLDLSAEAYAAARSAYRKERRKHRFESSAENADATEPD